MIDKALNTIKSNNMFQHGDKVIVAVSGGPDSICLLHVLYSLREILGIELVAAHVNHCLRGEEADRDEDYVKDFCERMNIEFYVKRENIHKISEEKGISFEMAGREARYSFFSEVMKHIGAQKIAIAHNANDQAETVLMRIIRGTGLEGLVGIKAVRDDIYVRPIIDITRKEIEDYCEKNNLRPRIDKTNLESIYTRNKIRLELIPYIEKNFNQDIVDGLNRLSNTVKIDNDYINTAALEVYKKYCNGNNSKIVISKETFSQHEAILTRVLRIALKELKGNLYNFDKSHIYDIINIQKGNTGKRLTLPQDVRVSNNYGDIHMVTSREESNFIQHKEEYILKINEKTIIKNEGFAIYLNIINTEKDIELNSSRLIKYFDYDKIQDNIKLRYRKSGDKFTPFGMKGSKKLKDLFIDLKIPKEEREKIPLILFGDEIAWIVGYRISERFKVNKNTKNILQIKIEREE